jgi:uncharacterized protein (DUF433 family)
MSLTIQADVPPLNAAEDGVVRVSGTRIPLERIVREFQAGSTPEQIVQDFDVLTVEQVYAVVNYYLHHRSEVDAYLEVAGQVAEDTRADIERSFPPAGIRARLLARRGGDRA